MSAMLRRCSLVLLLSCLAPWAAADTIHHLVLIWLKPEVSLEAREHMIARSQALGTIAGVSGFSIGSVVASDRGVVDDSFDVAITMIFSSKTAMDTYIDSTEHKQIVAQHIRPLAQKITVYDYRAVPPAAD